MARPASSRGVTWPRSTTWDHEVEMAPGARLWSWCEPVLGVIPAQRYPMTSIPSLLSSSRCPVVFRMGIN